MSKQTAAAPTIQITSPSQTLMLAFELGGGYWAPAGVLIVSITWSRLKLAAFWRGGNALKVARNSAT